MGDTDDIHNYSRRYENALVQLEAADISQKNKDLIMRFARASRNAGNRLSTVSNDINIMRWTAAAVKKDLDVMTEDDYYIMVERLEIRKKDTSGYARVVKKFFRWLTEDNQPKWVKNIRIARHETPVQPADLLTRDEIGKLLDACKHPRDKAFIAVLLDSCMRVGALGTLRVKNVQFNHTCAVLYMSTTSRNKKTTAPKPFPITWSTGYLNAWLDVHPAKNNPEAPLWAAIKGDDAEAMTYSGLVHALNRVVERSGLKKKVHYHLFKHQKVTEMILNGYSDREIRFQAGWSKNSNHMFNIYGNFYDEDMIKAIYARAGIGTEDRKQVTLQKCPRCRTVLVPEARVCHQCALVLDAALAGEVDRNMQEAQAFLLQFMKDPKKAAVLEMLLKA